MDFFIADIHFGHKNCLAYDNRPFTNIENHDQTIIDNWNEAVNITDDVYILGDVSWYNVTKTIKLFDQLNGRKHLIIGNHDGNYLKNPNFRSRFVEIENYKELCIDEKTSIVLSHYPIPCFKNHFYGWIHLYGHVHTSFEYNMTLYSKRLMEDLYTHPCRMYNVGAMVPYMDFTPRPLSYILQQDDSKFETNPIK